jgi:hypothetical protein
MTELFFFVVLWFRISGGQQTLQIPCDTWGCVQSMVSDARASSGELYKVQIFDGKPTRIAEAITAFRPGVEYWLQ